MPQLEAKLPSGAIVRVRGLKGKEINTFANATAARRTNTSLKILKSITVETVDTGPLYAEHGKVDWDNAPSCDRYVALYYARIATYGPEFTFKHQCKSTECRKRFEWSVDLTGAEIKPLPDSSIENFLDKNRFKCFLMDNDGSDVEVEFQLVTPRLEKKVDQVTKMAPKERATAGLAQRIVRIGTMTDKGDIKRYLEDLDAGSIYALVEEMDEVDGGIETEAEIDCTHCGYIEDIEVFGQPEFWKPPKKKSSSKRTGNTTSQEL